MSTDYHAKYYAHELTKRFSSDKLEKLSQSFFNATVDLNPHQIDAALFAFRSPLSRGAILADEVGLGKTVEAGLIISQLWAERKRNILIIVPASLREQWSRELDEKFFIDSMIIESKNFNQLVREGIRNPFEQTNRIVICSYHVARAKAKEIQEILWDLVVIDEAHRLRNVYRKDNKIAKAILEAIGSRPKVLLTATPLQNSLMELYGLITFIDPHLFGSEQYFRSEYVRRVSELGSVEFNTLKARIRPVCHRTLRRQVLEYVRYTNRISITQDFTPSDDEQRLYELVSDYLQRQDSFALPAGQRSLMTLVLRKILASSSFAIANTLERLVVRLENDLRDVENEELNVAVEEDYEGIAEIREEWNSSDDVEAIAVNQVTSERQNARKALQDEANELRQYKNLAESITENAKGNALLLALQKGFQKAAELEAPRKVLIFTESRRTQSYLKELLEQNGYAGEVVTLNGTNTDPSSQQIYKDWLQRHKDDDLVTGSKTVDLRSALVEEFKRRSPIMIATESGAEGLNMQFCNLVVNYDLPWNPQRIEQRIGRCHRYGQEHDVVVINFLNRRNAADERVFQLLSQKFQLFDGVFGASDEVLGALESGVDFEKRVNEIYRSTRKPEEISAAFDQLQLELEEQIQARLQDTRAILLENFDEEVHPRFRLNKDQTQEQISRFEQWLWRLTRHELREWADFRDAEYGFLLKQVPEEFALEGVVAGRYRLITQKNGEHSHHYRLGHPLAEQLLNTAKTRELSSCELIFRYDQYPSKISVIENLQGKSGWLRLSLLTIKALEKEEYLVFCATTDDGTVIDCETCEKLFNVTAVLGFESPPSAHVTTQLTQQLENRKAAIIEEVGNRNHAYFESEMDKLENWADDLKQGLEYELKELDREIKALKREARHSPDLNSKVELHKKAKDMEKRRSEKRKKLFEAQDRIDDRKENLISEIEVRLQQQSDVLDLFLIRWTVK